MFRSVLIDLSGTLHIDDRVIPGAVEALKKLRATNVQIKFVTNTTKESRDFLHNRLVSLGFQLNKNEIYSSLIATRQFLVNKKLKPLLFLEEEALDEFHDLTTTDTNNQQKYDAVVIGLAPTQFHYEKLNEAFRCLQNGGQLIAIHASKYYQRNDGLALGPGMFVRGLEYAANCRAHIVGKPNEEFFLQAIDQCKPEETVMIGDDVHNDVLGAIKAGMHGILVQTGKYRLGDERFLELESESESKSNASVAKDFAAAVDEIINKCITNNK